MAVTDDVRELSKDYSTFQEDLANFRGRVDAQLAGIRWVGIFFSGVLVSFFVGSLNVAWNAAMMSSEVKQQGMRIEKVESRLDQLEKSSEIIIQQLGAIQRRLDSPPAR